jgi:hypothetical protein
MLTCHARWRQLHGILLTVSRGNDYWLITEMTYRCQPKYPAMSLTRCGIFENGNMRQNLKHKRRRQRVGMEHYYSIWFLKEIVSVINRGHLC